MIDLYAASKRLSVLSACSFASARLRSAAPSKRPIPTLSGACFTSLWIASRLSSVIHHSQQEHDRILQDIPNEWVAAFNARAPLRLGIHHRIDLAPQNLLARMQRHDDLGEVGLPHHQNIHVR